MPLGQDSSSHAESVGKRLRGLVDGKSAMVDTGSIASRTIMRSRELRANPARKKL